MRRHRLLGGRIDDKSISQNGGHRLLVKPPFGLSSPRTRLLLQFFADSIEEASRVATAKWGVTPFMNGARLNVGFCEALTITADEFRILAIGSVLPPLLPRAHVLVGPGYSSSPGSVIITIDANECVDLRRFLAGLRPAHQQALAVSATRGFNAGARDGHSDGAVQLIGQFLNRALPLPSFERRADSTTRWEGAIVSAQASRVERSRTAREACIAHHGSQCSVCEMLFEQRYGPEAEGLIHVHHLLPIATRGGRHPVNAVQELRPVCPNCHAVIHAVNPPRSIESVRRMLTRPI